VAPENADVWRRRHRLQQLQHFDVTGAVNYKFDGWW